MGVYREDGSAMGISENGFFIKVLTGVAVCILFALVTGIYQFSGWQGKIDTRVANIERNADNNRSNIIDLTRSINENTNVTAVLAERMQAIITRMDERDRRRDGTRQ